MRLLSAHSGARRLVPKAIISLLLCAGLAYADEIRLQENAPDRYVVVKGDTLWDISGKFLKDPWRWPQIWKMNKEEIKNPHWIYPGDVIILDRSGGDPRLRLLRHDANDRRRAQQKIDPKVRITQLFDSQAAPTIPYEVLEPFLARPLVIDNATFKSAPRIGLGPDERVILANGDRAYAVGIEGANRGDAYQIFQAGKNLVDPDTKEQLGYEVKYVGEAVVEATGDVSTLRITTSTQEIQVGDRLVAKPLRELQNYIPHVPENDVRGKVISTYNGVNDAGTYTTLVINRGAEHGLEPGNVLFTMSAPRQLKREDDKEPVRYTPSEKIGNLMVYRVFPRISYGLLLDSTQPVHLQDEVRKPF
ncbi:LysM peptidoglycan-binding domain-containing protein [Chitinimonas lacunae]|uniref:LysM peptidoglycan-binding domain-containing protein n=1 Tax=Chitinimonas lacunae TaxID=1963018 RepID=A0ABV8MS01_9NEIS